VFDEIACHEHPPVYRRTGTFAVPMVTIGIRHVAERLTQFDEAIHKSFGHLKMGVGL